MAASTKNKALNVLIALASSIIVIAGLKLGKAVFLPILLAVFIAFLGQTPVLWLKKKGVPAFFASSIVALLTSLGLAGLGLGLVKSVSELKIELPRYLETLNQTHKWIMGLMSQLKIQVPADFSETLSGEQLGQLISQGLSHIFSTGSFILLVTCFVFFVLLEFSNYREKFEFLAREKKSLKHLRKSCDQVRKYIAVKSLMCIITGTSVGLLFYFADIKFALLWAILAFLFNYIPIVGSLLIAIPPLLIALADHGLPTAMLILVIYVMINLSISNILEPIMMGNQLGLSPLAVFSTLVFWGWLWGPVGMLLSVPLTRITKIFLENTHELRWLGVLLGARQKPIVDSDFEPTRA